MSASRQPLDLRLLPVALCCWAAALIAVHLPWAQSLRAAAVLIVVAAGAVLTLAVCYRRRGCRIIGIHMVLCAALAAVVLLIAAQTLRAYDRAGWDAAVESGVPVQVTLRVTEDSQPLSAPSRDGTDRVRVRAVVQHHVPPGANEPVHVGAETVLIHPAGDQPGGVEPAAGHRYTGLVSLSGTDPGDRATALVIPFGREPLEQLEPDRQAQLTGVFSGMRAATTELAAPTIGDAPDLLPGVVLGDRSGMDPQFTELMYLSGLSHLTVISGTHCSLVMGALLGLMRLLRAPRWSGPPVLLVGLVLFVMLVQPAPSVIRASVMGAIGALAVFAGRGRASSALLCLCVVILLLYDPWFSVEPAFQLSVVATAGIVLVGQRLNEMFARALPRILAAPLALACSSQVFAVPVLLPIAEGVNTYSVPANILAGPLLPFVTVPGTLAAVLSTTLPGVSGPLLWLAGLPAAGIGLIGRIAGSLPQALAPWPVGWLGWALLVVYLVAAVVLCWMLIESRRPYWWESTILTMAAAGVIALILPARGFGDQAPGEWQFALCDVEQGDMLVIRTKERAGIVVDAGEDPERAAHCLRVLGVETVEVLMITHEHADHYGGASGVLEAAEIGSVLYSGSSAWSPEQDIPELAEERIPIRRARLGESSQYDDDGVGGVSYTVWAAYEHFTNPNDNSLVVLFELIGSGDSADAAGPANSPVRLLTTGDLEEEVAGLMLRRGALPAQVDVLKVSHHGAANGGTAIIEHTSPSAALIGVGENDYGHPAPEILDSLVHVGAAVYRTDMHGTVAFSLTPSGGIEATQVPG